MKPHIATMAYLAETQTDLLVKCSGPYDKTGPHPVHKLPFETLVQRYGAATRMCDLEARYTCAKCGRPIATDVVSTRGEPRRPPTPPGAGTDPA